MVELFYEDTWNEWVSSGASLEDLTSVFLYSSGVINEEMIGNFVAYNYKSSTSGATKFGTPSITKGANYLTLARASSAMGAVFSSISIDVTNFSKIKINKISTNSGGSSNYTCSMGLCNEIKNNYVVATSISIKGSGDTYLDISELSGKYFLYFALYSATTKIYSIQLIK